MPAPLHLVAMDTVASQPINWLWRPYVPLGKLTLVMGDPEAGKSWLTLALASAVSRGGLMYDQPVLQDRTLLLSAEDGLADTIRPRLDMLGADPSNVIAVEDVFELSGDGIERLRAAIEDIAPALVIIDPIIAYTGQRMDTYRANQVRALMKQLSHLAETYNTAIVNVIHMRKERNGSALLGVQGSMDFIAAARSAIQVGREEGAADEERTMAHAKSSVAKKGPSLRYVIGDGRFEWLGESTARADDLSAPAVDYDERTERMDARSVITRVLGDLTWHPSSELIEIAKEHGIAERTLKKARAKLGVEVEKRAEGWWCRLPPRKEEIHV